ncbi:MAG TPA: hypothetical protein VKZ63_16255 [Kofleriaceae bacterium]|nr:hypothetical protein [Kofleriaceae bacterium]
MRSCHRHACALGALSVLLSLHGVALAQEPAPAEEVDPFAMPDSSGTTPLTTAEVPDAEVEESAEDKKEPGRGDFDAGGQIRLPNGPDEDGQYATFNWIALDLVGRYYLLDFVTLNGYLPLAVWKPSDLEGGAVDPKLIGGMKMGIEFLLPKSPFLPKKYEVDVGLELSGVYMRERAILLSPKDYPLFVGDFKPGFVGGLNINTKLSEFFDFRLDPAWLYQSGTDESVAGIQLPMALVLKVGSLVKLSADLGIYTGDDYSFRGSNGGRISTGGALTVKIGPILAHAGAGVASLLTGPAYPTITDSVYVDLNVTYAK